MAKNRKDKKPGPNKQAARAAQRRREQRMLEMDPLFHGKPPYAGYREWLTPHPVTGRFEVTDTAPMETRLYFQRIEELLVPLYRGKVPMAATYLDDRIKSGVIPIVGSDEPEAAVSVMPVAQLAEDIGPEDGNGHGHEEVCPQLNCTSRDHVDAEHRVWTHLHHLHAAGLLLINEQDAVRFTAPPRQPGDTWQFLSPGAPMPSTRPA